MARDPDVARPRGGGHLLALGAKGRRIGCGADITSRWIIICRCRIEERHGKIKPEADIGIGAGRGEERKGRGKEEEDL
jgi:hypothetical protein